MKLTITFIIIMILGFGLLVYMHELVHVEIYKAYGIESYVSSDFPDAVTIPIGSTKDCNDACNLAHNINEAVTYPLLAFYFLLGIALTIIIGILEVDHE